MRQFLILLLCTCLCAGTAYSQNYTVQGVISDKSSPLPGASIIVFNSTDSSNSGTAADDKGHFILEKLHAGKYQLRISFLGFETYKSNFRLIDANLNLGKIVLKEAVNTLDEVKVVEKIIAATQKGDTTEFNANAYKTNPDADASDLVKKMPGLSVTGSNVKAQGESVTKVLIDGKPFFGNDPYGSLRNLPAEVIDKVQVYNEKSDQEQFTGFNEGKTTKTINIITKLDKRNGNFGKIYAGYGTQEDNTSRYIGGGTINNFQGDERITVTAQSNNVNMQNFSDQNLNGMSSGGAGTMVTRSVGINYNNKIGKKIDINGSYSFNGNDNSALRNTRRQYVLAADSGQVYNELNNSNNNSYSHRLYVRINYNIDSMNSLLIDPQLSLQKSYNNSSLLGTTSQAEDTLNRTVNDNRGNTLGYMFSGNILFRHKFNKAGRTFSININASNNHNNGVNYLNAQNIFYNNAIASDTLNQKANSLWNNWSIMGNATYTEPIDKKGQLQLQYSYNTQPGNSIRNTNNYSLPDGSYTIPDSALSNTFTSNNTIQKVGGSYQHSAKKIIFSAGLYYQIANLYNSQTIPYESVVSKTFDNLLPVASFQYKISNKRNLQVNYNAATNSPSVTQLQNVINNTNTLQLTTGNPDLRQPYSHNIVARYSSIGKNSNMFFATLNGSYIQHVISNKSIIADSNTILPGNILLPKGSQLNMPVNIDGAWSLYANVTYGTPFSAIKSNLNFTLYSGITNTPGIINDIINNSRNENLGLGLTISSNISENIDFTLTSNASYNTTQNSINTAVNANYFNQSDYLTFNWILPGAFVLNTQMNYQVNSGLSDGFNQNFLLWNIGFGKKIFKKRQGDIRLIVYDLLKQNNSIQHSVTESYISDVRSNILQRYFMLTFTYNLRNFHK
ncbi:MAG: TonB-dependent receptor [Flavipsychrobacter sp.]